MIDLQQIESRFNPNREQKFFNVYLHTFESVGSTNQIAWELAGSGAEIGTTVVAKQQHNGKGQWGRQWHSSLGGLYLSTLIYQAGTHLTPLAASDSYQLTFATAWGIAHQLRNCGVPIELKWPNDLILEHRKLGGILTETKVVAGKITRAVVGVGINWQNPVPKTGISLKEWQDRSDSSDGVADDFHQQKLLKIQINSLEVLIIQILRGMELGLTCLFDEGVSILLPRYLKFLRNMGEQVYVDNSLGTIVGVTPSGCLHVRIATSETKSVNSREIYLSPGTISLGYRKPEG